MRADRFPRARVAHAGAVAAAAVARLFTRVRPESARSVPEVPDGRSHRPGFKAARGASARSARNTHSLSPALRHFRHSSGTDQALGFSPWAQWLGLQKCLSARDRGESLIRARARLMRSL